MLLSFNGSGVLLPLRHVFFFWWRWHHPCWLSLQWTAIATHLVLSHSVSVFFLFVLGKRCLSFMKRTLVPSYLIIFFFFLFFNQTAVCRWRGLFFLSASRLGTCRWRELRSRQPCFGFRNPPLRVKQMGAISPRRWRRTYDMGLALGLPFPNYYSDKSFRFKNSRMWCQGWWNPSPVLFWQGVLYISIMVKQK